LKIDAQNGKMGFVENYLNQLQETEKKREKMYQVTCFKLMEFVI